MRVTYFGNISKRLWALLSALLYYPHPTPYHAAQQLLYLPEKENQLDSRSAVFISSRFSGLHRSDSALLS
jgi:hypothetical protein